MWTKEECRQFFSKVLGLDLTDEELDGAYAFLSTNTATAMPRHGSPNAGFSPNTLQFFIKVATERTGLQLDHPRFKKVREELLPAAHFAILLRKLGYGNFLLVSSDMPNPDISLVKMDPAKINASSTSVDALPVELMYVDQHALDDAKGSSNVEKIANAIIRKKFSKSYLSQTILIVTLYSSIPDADLEAVRNLLPTGDNNRFHQVWLCLAGNESTCTLAMLTPTFEIQSLTREDLATYSY